MAIVNGPLLSFSASGSIAKTITYSRWKGRPYARRLVTPANPRSTAQTTTRSLFAWLSNVWKVAPSEFMAPWTLAAKGQVLTNRNLFFKANIDNMRGDVDVEAMTLSPGAAGGLTVLPSVTGGVGTITIDLTEPSPLPAGWSIVKAVGVAIRDQDPQTATMYNIVVGDDETSTYSVVLTSLGAGDWLAGGWFVYQRSTSPTDLAYGASLGEIVTVT